MLNNSRLPVCRERKRGPPQDETLPGRRNCIAKVLWICIWLITPFAVAHFAAAWGFLVDIMANVGYFSTAPLVLLAAGAAMARRRAASLLALSLAALAAIPWLTRLEWPTPVATEGGDASILFCNLQGKPSAWARLRLAINRHQPDLIAIVETNQLIVERLTGDFDLATAYPYQLKPQPALQWQQILLSRYPLQLLKPAGEFERYRFLYTFRRTAMVDLPDGRILFTVEHPPSPRTHRAWASGNRQIRLLGELVKSQLAETGLPIVVAGDFNCSPTGYRDSLLREVTGLHPDPIGGLNHGTWPTYLPSCLRLPLDRVWANEQIAFTRREVLEDVGSDHLPVLVLFQIRATD